MSSFMVSVSCLQSISLACADRTSDTDFYGAGHLDDLDEFSKQGDWHAPGLAEERIDQLFAPFTSMLKRPPTFISLHSGRTSVEAPLWLFATHLTRSLIFGGSLGSGVFRPTGPHVRAIARRTV
jgi:hypothetical protein